MTPAQTRTLNTTFAFLTRCRIADRHRHVRVLAGVNDNAPYEPWLEWR